MIVDLDRLNQLLETGTPEQLEQFAAESGLVITDGVIKFADAQQAKLNAAYWDKRQLVKKIVLNSAYGGLLNPHCRFNDKRIGQSTTLSGRVIARHMNAFVNQCVTGEYDHTGEAIIYSDTDSSFFTVWPTLRQEVTAGSVEWNREICVSLYDSIAEQVNASFPGFCREAFNVPEDTGQIIRCGRELVGSRGLYITKKRYAVLIYDLEGRRLDLASPQEAQAKGLILGEGKLKAMGLDLKRADTPPLVQNFLTGVLIDVLLGREEAHVIQKVREFKSQFEKLPPWHKGTPKRVNNLSRYRKLLEQGKNSSVPGHVRASLNWNFLRSMHNDRYSIEIVDGMKIIVCKLKNNPLNFTSVAYPIDEGHLPQWFVDLPFDNSLMETTNVDGKVENLLRVLNWDLQSMISSQDHFTQLFSFE